MSASPPDTPEPLKRVLTDESVPHDLLHYLSGFDAATVQSLGWAGMKNGVLLQSARDAGFDILVTVDRRIEYQQNIAKSGIALVVLYGRSTRVADLLPLIPVLLTTLGTVRPGEVARVAP